MLESYLPNAEQVSLYDVSDYPFNFGFSEMPTPATATKVQTVIDEWIGFLPPGKTANWVVRSKSLLQICIINHHKYSLAWQS